MASDAHRIRPAARRILPCAQGIAPDPPEQNRIISILSAILKVVEGFQCLIVRYFHAEPARVRAASENISRIVR
jgi:hypothetical protein